MEFQILSNEQIGLSFPKDAIELKKQYKLFGKEPLECSYIEYKLIFKYCKRDDEKDARDILDRCLQEGVANGILQYSGLVKIGDLLERYYNDKHNKLTQGHYPRDFYEPLGKNTRYTIELPDFTTKEPRVVQHNIFEPFERQLPHSYFWIELQCGDKEVEMYVCICDILGKQFPCLKECDGNFYIEGRRVQEAFLEIYRVFGSLSKKYGKHVMSKLSEFTIRR
ncbi:MAG: hypothetical protein K2N54_01550 [Helicobacter sp.]|nr:hypothetical protein [Helicobacter sp.]